MWLPFALLSAFISGGKRVYEKHLTSVFGNFAMGFVIQAFALIPHLILIFILPGGTDIGDLPWRFWWPLIIIWLVLYPVQTYFLYRAMREGDLSSVVPAMCLLPVFNVGTSYLLLGELPSAIGFAGICLIVVGTYLTLWQKGEDKSLSVPVLMMIAAMFCIAIGSSLDKISLEVSNPVFYGFMNTLGATLVFIVLMHFYKEMESFGHMKLKFWTLNFLGSLQAVTYVLTMYAYKYGPVSYVLAIKAGSYVFVGLYGVIFLKESFSDRKQLAFLCFILGVLALALA